MSEMKMKSILKTEGTPAKRENMRVHFNTNFQVIPIKNKGKGKRVRGSRTRSQKLEEETVEEFVRRINQKRIRTKTIKKLRKLNEKLDQINKQATELQIRVTDQINKSRAIVSQKQRENEAQEPGESLWSRFVGFVQRCCK
ncbi:hypothetical protein XENTR_v10017138 [Xenopus tropicalis]|nr:hypothetical protein XENTR_v10017138 [Xenopus tropicalis]